MVSCLVGGLMTYYSRYFPSIEFLFHRLIWDREPWAASYWLIDWLIEQNPNTTLEATWSGLLIAVVCQLLNWWNPQSLCRSLMFGDEASLFWANTTLVKASVESFPPQKKKHPWSVSIWRLLGILKLSNQARGRESQQIWFKLLNLKLCVNTQCVQKVFKTPASPQQNHLQKGAIRNRHLHAGSAHRILLLRL